MTFLPTKRCLLRLFATYSFLVNRDQVIFVLRGLLHVLCMGWEVKIDMSGQSNGCLRICNVKMKKILPGRKQGTSLRMYGLRGFRVDQFENFFMGFGVPISLTVVDIFRPISTRSRCGTWEHTWSMYHCMYLG